MFESDSIKIKQFILERELKLMSKKKILCLNNHNYGLRTTFDEELFSLKNIHQPLSIFQWIQEHRFVGDVMYQNCWSILSSLPVIICLMSYRKALLAHLLPSIIQYNHTFSDTNCNGPYVCFIFQTVMLLNPTSLHLYQDCGWHQFLERIVTAHG